MDIIELKNQFSDIMVKIGDYIHDSRKNGSAPEELLSLYQRAQTLIGVLVLNYGRISEIDIERVTTVSKFCDSLISLGVLPSKESVQNFFDLVDSLEDDFIAKRFLLLDKEAKHIV